MNAARSGPPASLYVAGPFSMGYVDFFTLLIPLYGLSLGLDAAEIGILVGARSILALFLSIHIGVLMDRFGTRRVTLFFVWTGMALAPLFPLVPGFWGLLLLQLLNGGAVSFAWSGAQTLIAQLAEGDARYIGRFSFFCPTWLDDGAHSGGHGLGFWRSLVGLSLRRRLGCGFDDCPAAHTRGRDFRCATSGHNGTSAVPRPRRFAPRFGLRHLDHDGHDPGHCRVDGDYLDA
jgi:hypothetical protein